MKKMWWVVLIAGIAAALLLSACASKAPAAANETPVPADYAGKTNPFSGQAAAADAGKQIFTDNCASCHGDGGKGDGPAGASLDPKPANLTVVAPTLADDRIFWIVSEGGAAAGKSASMASWKGTLSSDEIWQAITYVRTLK